MEFTNPQNFSYDPILIDSTLTDENDKVQAHLIAQVLHTLYPQLEPRISWNVNWDDNSQFYTIVCCHQNAPEITDDQINRIVNACPVFVDRVKISLVQKINIQPCFQIAVFMKKASYFSVDRGRNKVVEFIRIIQKREEGTRVTRTKEEEDGDREVKRKKIST